VFFVARCWVVWPDYDALVAAVLPSSGMSLLSIELCMAELVFSREVVTLLDIRE